MFRRLPEDQLERKLRPKKFPRRVVSNLGWNWIEFSLISAMMRASFSCAVSFVLAMFVSRYWPQDVQTLAFLYFLPSVTNLWR